MASGSGGRMLAGVSAPDSALRVTIPATMCRDRTVGEERTTTAVVMCTQDEGRVLGKPGLVVSAT
jgi:hypothetical protein